MPTSCVTGDFMCMPVSHKWFIHMDFPRPICFIGAWLFHIRQRLLVPPHKHLLNNKRVGPGSEVMCSLISNLNLSVERVICHSPVGFYWQGLSYYSFAHKGIHINTPTQAHRSWTPATSCSLVTPQGREHVNAKAVSNGYWNRQRLRGRGRSLPLLSLRWWLLEVQPLI